MATRPRPAGNGSQILQAFTGARVITEVTDGSAEDMMRTACRALPIEGLRFLREVSIALADTANRVLQERRGRS